MEANEVWNSRCQKLWSDFTHLRSRFILWRLLSHGYYCNYRGRLWGVDPECPICEDAPEMIVHLFYECPRVKHRWDKLGRDARNTPLDFRSCSSLADIILLAIAQQPRCPSLFLLVTKTIALTWNERNAVVFHDHWSMAPSVLIWRRVASNLDAIWIWIINPRISRILGDGISLIRSFLMTPQF